MGDGTLSGDDAVAEGYKLVHALAKEKKKTAYMYIQIFIKVRHSSARQSYGPISRVDFYMYIKLHMLYLCPTAPHTGAKTNSHSPEFNAHSSCAPPLVVTDQGERNRLCQVRIRADAQIPQHWSDSLLASVSPAPPFTRCITAIYWGQTLHEHVNAALIVC